MPSPAFAGKVSFRRAPQMESFSGYADFLVLSELGRTWRGLGDHGACPQAQAVLACTACAAIRKCWKNLPDADPGLPSRLVLGANEKKYFPHGRILATTTTQGSRRDFLRQMDQWDPEWSARTHLGSQITASWSGEAEKVDDRQGPPFSQVASLSSYC